MTKPVLAYIAGFSAPPGQDDGARRRDHLRLVGHRGSAKKDALEARGIEVGTTPTEVAQIVADRHASVDRTKASVSTERAVL